VHSYCSFVNRARELLIYMPSVRRETGHTHTHARQEQHPKRPREEPPPSLNDRRWRGEGAYHLPHPGGWPRRTARLWIVFLWVHLRSVVRRVHSHHFPPQHVQIDRVIKVVHEKSVTSYCSSVNSARELFVYTPFVNSVHLGTPAPLPQ